MFVLHCSTPIFVCSKPLPRKPLGGASHITAPPILNFDWKMSGIVCSTFVLYCSTLIFVCSTSLPRKPLGGVSDMIHPPIQQLDWKMGGIVCSMFVLHCSTLIFVCSTPLLWEPLGGGWWHDVPPHSEIGVKNRWNRLFRVCSTLFHSYFCLFHPPHPRTLREPLKGYWSHDSLPPPIPKWDPKIGSIVCSMFVLHCSTLIFVCSTPLLWEPLGGGWWHDVPPHSEIGVKNRWNRLFRVCSTLFHSYFCLFHPLPPS